MNILCTICARGGSKGVPHKNIKLLDGKPLIAYTIECAKKWGKYTDLIVSTDDEKIAEVAKEHGVNVPFLRPDYLADDDTSRIDAVKHAYDYMTEKEDKNYDFIIDLSVTTPFRIPKDIEDTLNKLISDNEANNIYTVCNTDKNPYFNLVELDNEGYASLSKSLNNKITSRQTAPDVFEMNDAINIFKSEYLEKHSNNQSNKTLIYKMPRNRSVDIDSILDFKYAEFLIGEGQLNNDEKLF